MLVNFQISCPRRYASCMQKSLQGVHAHFLFVQHNSPFFFSLQNILLFIKFLLVWISPFNKGFSDLSSKFWMLFVVKHISDRRKLGNIGESWETKRWKTRPKSVDILHWIFGAENPLRNYARGPLKREYENGQEKGKDSEFSTWTENTTNEPQKRK